MWGLILWIFMFMCLVIAHELWHFISAKRSWVKVLEFWIWIPPKIAKIWTDKSGTEYTLNLIPLWGFVRLKGEDPSDSKEFNAKDSFLSAKLLNKIVILLAWVFMNTLLAWIIFTSIFTLGTKPIQIVPDNIVKGEIESYLTPTKYFLYSQWLIDWENIEKNVIIEDIFTDWLASKAWLTWWDILIAINDTQLDNRNLERTLKNHIGTTFELQYKRNKINNKVSITCPKNDCLMGITYKANINPENIKEIKLPLFTAMKYGFKEIWAQTKMTLGFLWNFGRNIATLQRTNIKESLHKMTWPAWAIKFGDMILQSWWWKVYLWFAGMISLALAIFNVLPIPALDWWRLLWILIQTIWRLKKEKYFNIEWYINLIFFVLLLWLWIYILFQDLIRVRWINIPFLS